MRGGVLFGLGLWLATPGMAENIAYGYDALGRVTAVGRSQGSADGFRTVLSYDPADNRSLYTVRDVRFSLSAGQSVSSADGRTHLTMQSDGNLVVNFQGSILWSSGTSGSGATKANMQSDGNLVLYTASNGAVWTSGTSGNYGAALSVGNDANVIIFGVSYPIWATNTGGH